MRIQSIELRNWRRFAHLEIDFDDHLTVITGRNNSGKSSLLEALNVLLSPRQLPIVEPAECVSEPFSPPHGAASDDSIAVGSVRYKSGRTIELRTSVSAPHDIPSPRPTPTTPGILISSHADWPLSDDVEISGEQWAGYIALLERVLPASMYTHAIGALDSESPGRLKHPRQLGGLRATLGTLWQLYLLTAEGRQRDAVVLVDEPDAHLHPTAQREVLPRLFAAAPDAQFVVATHSPFIVSADPNARIYVLTESEDGRITAQRAEDLAAHGTANDVLRAGLGVPSTLPIWVEQRLADLANRLVGDDLPTNQPIDDLYRQLAEIGLQDHAPEILARLLAERRGERD